MKKTIKATIYAADSSGPGRSSVTIVAKNKKLMPWALRLPVKRSEIGDLIGRSVTIMVVVEGPMP